MVVGACWVDFFFGRRVVFRVFLLFRMRFGARPLANADGSDVDVVDTRRAGGLGGLSQQVVALASSMTRRKTPVAVMSSSEA